MDTQVTKIVTARNTAFIVGHRKESTEGSATITRIELTAGYLQDDFDYCVTYSDGTEVSVSDVVEVWFS